MHFLTINESLHCPVSLALQRTPLIPRKKRSLATEPPGLSQTTNTTLARRFRVGGNLLTNDEPSFKVNLPPRRITKTRRERKNSCEREGKRGGKGEWPRCSRTQQRLSLAHLYAQTSGQRYHDTSCEWHPLGGIPTMPRLGSQVFSPPSCFSE